MAVGKKLNLTDLINNWRVQTLLLAAALLGGCATYTPGPQVPVEDLHDVQSDSIAGVTVSVAMLTDEQASNHFGVNFRLLGLQALWIRVENRSERRYWFIRNAVDRDFYSPDEAALVLHQGAPRKSSDALRQYLRDEAVRVLVHPDTIVEGYLYLPRVEGGRYVDVRLAADAYHAAEHHEQAYEEIAELRFGFPVRLPDGEFDYERLDAEHTYAGMDLPDLDEDGLRAALRELPCCAMNESGTEQGDPLNLVMVGAANEVLTALSRSGWSFTHRLSLRTVRRMLGAAIGGDGYPVAPVSNLYVFDRAHDFALQRARATIARRNHLRAWLAPFTFNGMQVWVGQVSRDIGVKLTASAPSLTTHIIDPEVDLTREYLLHSLLAEGLVSRFGFISGAKEATLDAPAYNLTGDPYFSDGKRLVVMLSTHPRPYYKVRSLMWEESADPMREGQSDAAREHPESVPVEY